MTANPFRSHGSLRSLVFLGCFGASLALAGCSSGSTENERVGAVGSGVQLTAVHHGKLVDVYGLRTVGQSKVIELFESDIIVGLDILDERTSTSNKNDEDILYDFISANADTLQPRLLITREIGSDEFKEAFEALDDKVRLVSPSQWGRNTSKAPYSVVPRNAALRLTFSGNLGVTDDDFYVRDESGKISGYKNTEAIQLLKIVGNPNDNKHEGDFQLIHTRLRVRGNQIIVDPVLLGTEGLIYGNRNNAAGMPESPDQLGSNIRLAVALEGKLAIQGVAKDKTGSLSGRNNGAFSSIIRDFRSGNAKDNSSDLARGFIRDPEPPKLIGEMLMYIERVESVNESTKLLTIFKDGIEHEIDRGDLLRIYPDPSGPIASLEVLQDPEDDFGKPDVQRVRVLVRPVVDRDGNDLLERLDPTNPDNFKEGGHFFGAPDFPIRAGGPRDAWNRRYASKAVLVAEYTYRRVRPGGGSDPYYGDDPRNFMSFSPTPLPADAGTVIANENVSPFAGAIVRFSKPIDMSTLIALDTAFFATRNVLDQAAIDKFIKDRKIDEQSFNKEKFKTPHLIHSRIFDEDGSQTAIRVQPTLGFYLDDAMRKAAEEDKNKPFKDRRYHYFLHLVSGPDGIADLSGNPLDFQAVVVSGLEIADKLVLAFSLDARNQANSTNKRFENNLVAYIVRRFADSDEDERPNLYLPGEVTPPGGLTPADAYRSADFFGPIAYLPTGEMVARSAARVRKIVDNVNQIAAPPQSSPLRWCPINAGSGYGTNQQVIFQTAATAFGQPIQNPLNPYGCRLHTVWREIDMSLSRTDPGDFNLDVEQMYWAPFAGNAITFDEFDQVSLFLGHSEFRPEPCIHSGSAFPSMSASGLFPVFSSNYAHNLRGPGVIGYQPQPFPAYVDKVMSISAKDAILDPTGSNRFLPLPQFEDATKTSNKDNPYFVWRDEKEVIQGGMNGLLPGRMNPYPYILSPFLGGLGRRVIGPPSGITFAQGGWYNGNNVNLTNGQREFVTHGLVGAVALPLLADFWTYPDSPEKPVEDPFIASGINGWQISLAVTSSPRPYFRAYSAGRGGSSPIPVGPSHPNWKQARGGYTPTGGGTAARDNSVYWVMADFLKRTAVVTSGFVEITNPHRMPANVDPRLGPYSAPGMLPDFVYDFEPPLSTLPPGTSIVTEFRGASRLDDYNQWWPRNASNRPNATNFPLDPLKSGDAWVKHWDTRGGRNWWTYMYNRTVTSYTEQPNQLTDTAWTNTFSGPNESFPAKDVKYFNWRFVMKNNVEADPPVSPRIESFAVSYRFLEKK